MANTESTYEILKRVDALGRELEQLKRALLVRLKRETSPGYVRASLFGSIPGGDVTEEEQRDKGDHMITISKKFVVDEQGNPREVIIPLEDYKKIEEILGLDLDETSIRDLSEARSDREAGNIEAYEDLESI